MAQRHVDPVTPNLKDLDRRWLTRTSLGIAVLLAALAGGSWTAASAGVLAPPTKPQSVVGIGKDSSVLVSWKLLASPNRAPATGFTVTSSPSTSLPAACNGTTKFHCLFTGLQNGTAYKFRVTALSSSGSSRPSAWSSVVVPATAPTQPLNVAAAQGNGSASVSWIAPTDSEGSPIAGYTVSSTPPVSAPPACIRTAKLNCTYSGLTNGVSYTFQVVALNGAGTSALSDPSIAIVPARVPTAPRSVMANPGDGVATVIWKSPKNSGGLLIEGYTVTSSPPVSAPADCLNTLNLSCSFVGLTNGVSYTFTVVATNSLGPSAASSPSLAVTPVTLPSAPTNVTATPGFHDAYVTWSPPSSNGGARVIRYSVSSSPFASPPASCVSTKSLACAFTGLTAGTNYMFYVTATNSAGSSPSSSASATPVSPFPGSITSNWSGYVVPASGPIPGMSGRWTVPYLNCGSTPNSNSATWVGTGGDGPGTGNLLQTGTEDDCVGGSQVDRGWFELVPSSPNHEIGFQNFPVRPGDSMFGNVFYSADGYWVTQLEDFTTGLEGEFVVGNYWDVSDIGYNDGGIQGYAYATSYAGGTTAEWIVEDPFNGATSTFFPFANYGTVTFTNLLASISGWSLPGSDSVALVQGSQVLSMPGPAHGGSFTCTYRGISIFSPARPAFLATGDGSSHSPGGDFVAVPNPKSGSAPASHVRAQVPAGGSHPAFIRH